MHQHSHQVGCRRCITMALDRIQPTKTRFMRPVELELCPFPVL